MYLPIIQTIAEDRVREMRETAQRDRDVRLARQQSKRFRARSAEARTPAALRLVPARIRPRLT